MISPIRVLLGLLLLAFINAFNKYTCCVSTTTMLSMSLSNSDPSRRWKGTPEMPLINHIRYIERLQQYVDETPKRNVLMVYGAKSVGKTRAMLEKIKEWQSQGRLIVEINLKGALLEAADLPELFYKQYAIGKRKIDPNREIKDTIEDLVANIVKGRSFEGFTIPSVAGKVAKLLAPPLVSEIAENVADSMWELLSKQPNFTSTKEKIEVFLNTLEVEASTTGNRPVLIIREVQRLVDNSLQGDSKEIYKWLFTVFEKYKEGQRNVSVIIESSEYLWSDIRRFAKSSPQSFQEYQVEPWSKYEGRQELVEEYCIFTHKEYKKVWGLVGGHAGELFSLHCDLRGGMTLNEAILAKKSATLGMLLSVIEGVEGNDYDEQLNLGKSTRNAIVQVMADRMDILKLVKEHHYCLKKRMVSTQLELAFDYFTRSNILWVRNDGVASPIHKVMENAIEEYLSE